MHCCCRHSSHHLTSATPALLSFSVLLRGVDCFLLDAPDAGGTDAGLDVDDDCDLADSSGCSDADLRPRRPAAAAAAAMAAAVEMASPPLFLVEEDMG